MGTEEQTDNGYRGTAGVEEQRNRDTDEQGVQRVQRRRGTLVTAEQQ